MSFISKVLKLVVVLGVLALLVQYIQYWLGNKQYVFNKDDVAKLAKQYAGLDHELAFSKVVVELRKKYPGHILPDEDLQWVFVNAGGWMGSMCLLHASLTEYVLLLELQWTLAVIQVATGLKSLTPLSLVLSDSGKKGRQKVKFIIQIILKMHNEFKWITTGIAGDTIVHAVGEATSVQWSSGTWMVEYGRGFIPSTLGFALADTAFSTQDFLTLFYTVRVYVKGMLLEANTLLTETGVF